MPNWVIIAIIAVAVIAIAYLIHRRAKKAKVINNTPPPDANGGSTYVETKGTPASYSDTPFTTQAEGDAFRGWVNDNYPTYAAEISLDRSGDYDNSYIQRAYYHVGDAYVLAQRQNQGNAFVSNYLWGF